MTFKKILLLSVFHILLGVTTIQGQQSNKAQEAWVEKTFQSLSEDERIGQLFMVAAYSNKDAAHVRTIQNLVTKHHIGGLIFMQGGPVRQANLTNRYQSKAKVPLLISMDAEWGLGMRLDSTISYPRQMTLGAIHDDQYIYEMGKEIARQCKRLGVHVNFAPVVDVNVNPRNPVIGTRSFGENKENVARKGIAYAKGMQDHGVIANAKHFPGHGDTDKDSHLTLPIIKHNKARLDSIELYPFKRLIADSIMSMMVAHLYIPALDSTKNLATTLSPKVVNGLLKDSLGFNGLIFTDALSMQGVAKYFAAGEVDAKALLAGNDVLLFSENVPTGVKAIKKAIEDGKITWDEINQRVKKILRAKYFVGLDRFKPIETKGLFKELNSNQALLVKAQLYEQAVTMVKNANNLLPFQMIDSLSFASVAIGTKRTNVFQRYLSKYAPFENHVISSKGSSLTTYQNILNKVKKKKVVVVGVMGMNNSRGRKYGLHANTLEFIKRLEKETTVVVVVFGNPYSLKYFENSRHLVCAYEKDALMQKAVPQVLFGAIKNQAKLPVSASSKIKAGLGAVGLDLRRLQYSFPEAVGINSDFLTNKVDSIVNQAIKDDAMPGCQVLVAKDGIVVFEKAYGYTSYSKVSKTTLETIYDVASLTKVCATLQALMKLEGYGKFDLNKKVSDYLSDTKETNKGNLVYKEILTHQAGLPSFIPLFAWLMDESGSGYKAGYFSKTRSEKYPIEITKTLFGLKTLPDSVKKWTYDYDLRKRRNIYRPYSYRYSDIGFYLLKWTLEKQTGQRLDHYVESQFYKPLGLSTMRYLPLKKGISQRSIAPTEYDSDYRKGLVHGRVHDPGAALIGGVGGHAGVFSNANDMAILMQMNLQDGYYGGKRYLRTGTIKRFNTRPYRSNNNRRGIGWDKPVLSGHGGSTSKYSPHTTFGHTGFTGTCTWVDPENQLVYVFLSNRINPYARNTKLIKTDVRENILSAVYESFGIKKAR
ncbi:MAG: glycoside hydrolase family 3 N-terminal domain-containing protein [Flammeovirgaceae bacterium]